MDTPTSDDLVVNEREFVEARECEALVGRSNGHCDR
jgi:hypothetical protein